VFLVLIGVLVAAKNGVQIVFLEASVGAFYKKPGFFDVNFSSENSYFVKNMQFSACNT